MSEKWECFCDAGYYHKWAVRDANGGRKFDSAIHVDTQKEAEFLVKRLNQFVPERVKGLVEAAYSEGFNDAADAKSVGLGLTDMWERSYSSEALEAKDE